MDPDHSSATHGPGRFDPTRWSVVLEAAQSQAPGGPQALADLCAHYWPPLYAFARGRGHPPEDAQDFVQGFFEHLIGHRGLGSVDPAKGRFRSFLLVSPRQNPFLFACILDYLSIVNADHANQAARNEVVCFDSTDPRSGWLSVTRYWVNHSNEQCTTFSQ